MGVLQSLGRLWGGSGADRKTTSGNGDKAAQGRRPVAIDLHTPGAKGGVESIDRELSERLGLKPSPMPSREARVRQGNPAVALVAAEPVVPEVVEAVAIAVEDAPEPTLTAKAADGFMSSLLALPERHGRGKIRSKQQLLDQLRDNYEEVLRVVRKVDGQLDQQQRRGERMLEIAEHTVHGRLPELREETRKVGDAIDRLATGIGRGQDRLEKGVADQVAAIERVQGLLSELVENDRSLGESLVEFRRTAAGMAIATERLGGVLAGMQERAEKRDEQIAAVLDRSQKTLVTVLVLGIVSVAAAVVMVVLAVV